jgi:hypothetical protein
MPPLFEQGFAIKRGRKVFLMKTKSLIIGAFVLLVMLGSASAAGVDGKWIAKAGDVDITLTFKVTGTTLTGTVDNPQAGPTDIKGGKVEGDDISFYVVRKANDTDMKIVWKGKIAGDEIKFKRETEGGGGGMGGPGAGGGGGGGAMDIIAKRAK